MNDLVIHTVNLKKNYQKGNEQLEVLKGIDLSIRAGEIIGYLGSNGAGKSTTVKILCGLLPDFEGDAYVLGHNLKTHNLEIKQHIGYIPENAVMYEQLSPMEYLEFIGTLYGIPIPESREKAERLLSLFEMSSQANQRIVSFSKGMKQKIHIISGLLHNPDLIFMDEPLNGLDANAVIIVKEIMSQLVKEGKTIFYCSHLMDVVEKIASRIILLNNGLIVADGTVEALKEQSNASSLEMFFSKLTGGSDMPDKTGQIIDAFEKKEND